MNITLDLAQKIAGYLMTKPYQEVAEILAELLSQSKEQPASEQSKKASEPDKKKG